MTTSAQDFFQARGFGGEIGFGERPAVLCVDFMRSFTDPDHPLGADYTAELMRTNDVIAAARAREFAVFHTVVAYEDPGLLDAGLWRFKQKGSWTLLAGSDDVQPDDRLNVQDSDHVIVKKYASAFFGTDLLSRLVSAQIDTLVIAGCTTSGCVRASAVDAVQLGIRPIVVQDAVGDRSADAHRQSLFDLHQKYADVIAANDVIARLNEY